MVYPLQDSAFGGSVASWVGQYGQARSAGRVSVRGVRDGAAFEIEEATAFPAAVAGSSATCRDCGRGRGWTLCWRRSSARARTQKTIDEIIRAGSRKYKFVTPYTSFLAVPRALLRPRVIRPGDPVLRVHTDESISSVVAIFPFGLTKRLRYLDDEERVADAFSCAGRHAGRHLPVRLVLRDNAGHTYRESKTFVIASKPPVVTSRLDNHRYHRGDTIPLKVSATASTRTLVARLEGAAPVSLRWNQKAGANTGDLQVPTDLPAGSYRLTVIAEDVAHNIGTQEVQIEVLP